MIDKVKEIIAEELGIEVSSIKPDSNIVEDLEADSLSIMQIVMELESEYDIKNSWGKDFRNKNSSTNCWCH